MLKGKFEKLEFREMLSSPHWKIEINKNKTKTLKKEPREMKKWKKKMNERTMKNDLSWNDPWSDHPETQFEPTYPFFGTPNPGLHYVPKSPFRLNVDTWTEEVFFLWKIFVINEAVVSFPQPKFLINHSPVWNEFLSA